MQSGEATGAARVIAKLRADAAAGAKLDVTVGAPARLPAPTADSPERHLPLVTASAHGVAARAALDELGTPDFGKALRRWLDLERNRMFGELSNLDQVQAVATAYADREVALAPAVEPPRPPLADPPPPGGLRLIR